MGSLVHGFMVEGSLLGYCMLQRKFEVAVFKLTKLRRVWIDLVQARPASVAVATVRWQSALFSEAVHRLHSRACQPYANTHVCQCARTTSRAKVRVQEHLNFDERSSYFWFL
jgi:hypothetical protein